MLTSKFLPSTLGIFVLGLSFSSTANAQLIRQEFEGNFDLFDVSSILENTIPDNSDYSGFVLYSENGTLEDWEVNVNELDLTLNPNSGRNPGLGSDLIPDISFDLASPSSWDLSVDFGIAFDAPRFTVEREASEITFTGELGLAGGYVYSDPSATITQTSIPTTSVPEPGTLLGLLAVGGLGFATKIKAKV
ncbi:MAG: PEP-CTERM sorting domain-containing protein [Cyanobacteria bacterium J06592_8]